MRRLFSQRLHSSRIKVDKPAIADYNLLCSEFILNADNMINAKYEGTTCENMLVAVELIHTKYGISYEIKNCMEFWAPIDTPSKTLHEGLSNAQEKYNALTR